MLEKTPIGLIIQALSHEIDEKDGSLLEAWKASNMENTEIYEEIKRAWELSKKYKPPLDFNHEEAFLEFKKKYVGQEEEEKNRAEAPVIKLKPGKVYIPVAAALIILIAGYFVWNNFLAIPKYTTTTGPAELTELTLPDGSDVWLNENSSLTFNKKSFTRNREVSVSGNTYFEVISLEKNPFHVMMPTATIRVTGTSFHVNHYDPDHVQIMVDEGSVEVLHLETANSVNIQDGERVHIKSSGVITRDKIYSPNHAAWKNKGLSFISTPLSVAFSDIEQYYDIVIEVDSFITNGKTWTSPNLRNRDIREIAEILERNFHLEIAEVEDRLYSVKEK